MKCYKYEMANWEDLNFGRDFWYEIYIPKFNIIITDDGRAFYHNGPRKSNRCCLEPIIMNDDDIEYIHRQLQRNKTIKKIANCYFSKKSGSYFSRFELFDISDKNMLNLYENAHEKGLTLDEYINEILVEQIRKQKG